MHTMRWAKTAVGLVLTAGFLGVPANAALCGKCKDMMFIQSIGTCADCAGETPSSAHKICPKCSVKLGQCEHCRAALVGKDNEAKPAATNVAGSQAHATNAAVQADGEKAAGDAKNDAGGTMVSDPVSGMSVTFVVEGPGRTRIEARDSQMRMVWKASTQGGVNSLRIEGRAVVAMPQGMMYDLATGKALGKAGR